MPASPESAVEAFRSRVDALGRAGLPVNWAGQAAVDALAEAARLGADPEALLEAAVASGQDAASRARGAWRPWFYPALVCAGAAAGAALLAVGLAPVFEQVYAEFRVAPGSGLGWLETVRGVAGWLAAAAAFALAVAWWAATVWRSRPAPRDPLRTALACDTLAALAEAGVPAEKAGGVVRVFGADAAAVPFAAWATAEDLGGVARAEALRLASRVARARAARSDGEARLFTRIVVSVVIAGLAVFAYALVLFLPALDFFHAIADAAASR